MAEYQYYEFLAIDRPLDARQLAEVRALSTRATISPTHFQNEYHWGNFKGDPEDMMVKYYDAFIYTANWGSHWFMLRLPVSLVDIDAAARYVNDEVLRLRTTAEHVILSFSSDPEDGGWDGDDTDWMQELVPLRSELAAGDLRALYLAWLAGIQDYATDEEMEDEDGGPAADEDEDDGDDWLASREPPVPPGLGRLSASLVSLADFLRLSGDLLAVAAEASAAAAVEAPDELEMADWLRALPQYEKDAFLVRLVVEGDVAARPELVQRFLRERRAEEEGGAVEAEGSRTIRELLTRAVKRRERREREEAERAAQARARWEREEAAARAKYLDGLVGREQDLWRQVDSMADSKRPTEYDRAVRLLVDLRDLAERAGAQGAYRAMLGELRQRHARKHSFIARLDEAKLVPSP